MSTTGNTHNTPNTMPPPPPGGPEEDHVSAAESSTALFGLVIEYLYSTGRHYQLTFDKESRVKFAWLNHPPYPGNEEFIAPNLLYRAREIRPGLVFIHWIIKEASIHVAINVDLTEKKMHVGAMMPPNQWEFWDEGDIIKVTGSD